MPTAQQSRKSVPDARANTSNVLATLGHEMRNPLNALNNALHIWQLAKLGPEEMEQLRTLMQRQVRQLIRLSDDLLDAERIAQGTLELRREQILLRRVLDHACEEVRPFVDEHGHALTVKFPAEPIFVDGDASRLIQVFANLIQNAAKFTQPGGRIGVTLEKAQGTAVVRVQDNGPGIDHCILETFFTDNPLTHTIQTQGNDGLGIGLRLVRMIVALHQGAVAVQSDGLGCGSEFIVTLPLSGCDAK